MPVSTTRQREQDSLVPDLLADGLLTLEKQMACVLDFHRNMVDFGDIKNSVLARVKLSDMIERIKTLRALFLKEQMRMVKMKKARRNYKKCLKDISNQRLR